jgi:eukaryotic-like serine/threonine-protein kinase
MHTRAKAPDLSGTTLGRSKHQSLRRKVASDPVGGLARWQLGRAYASLGQVTQARSAYGDFLALWKDADLDIPVVQQAKIEYAKLR